MATASPAPVSSTSSEKSATTLNQSPICETALAAKSRLNPRLSRTTAHRRFNEKGASRERFIKLVAHARNKQA